MERSQIHRVSVADQVASILRQRILTGELRPGTSLQEVPMAASLGVSRNTMREATRILSLEGLLKRSIHRGVAVSKLSPKDVKEIYHLRRMLEIPAVLAAKSNHEVFPELRAELEGYERAVQARSWMRAVGHDLHFHNLLVRFHNNRRLDSFYQKLTGEVRMGMVLVDMSHEDPNRLIPIHRRIYELLEKGKLQQCAATLARHLDDSEARLSEVMRAQDRQGAKERVQGRNKKLPKGQRKRRRNEKPRGVLGRELL
ncbi:MAG TPA: GntR family transcriptional regulator [Terriglobales bacterium]|nr:GntR family transcriptional regulator [Terriglobales bacterium]